MLQLNRQISSTPLSATIGGPTLKLPARYDLLIFLVLTALLVRKALVDVDVNWDSLAYHFPFAALRVGLLKPEEFVLQAALKIYYSGAPVLQDFIKGWLWALTGN